MYIYILYMYVHIICMYIYKYMYIYFSSAVLFSSSNRPFSGLHLAVARSVIVIHFLKN